MSRYVDVQIEKRMEHLDFDVESWYPWLKDLTFGTKFLHISLPEARALVVYYQHRYNSRRPPTAEELSLLQGLEENIDAAMAVARQELPNAMSAVFFVRLSIRSPKDAVAVTVADYERALLRVEADESYSTGDGPEWKVNQKMVALSDCQAKMAVDSGLAVMKLLTSSERVFVDLLTATAADELYLEHPVSVALRLWEERLNHRMEFRSFVSNGELTAVSQYNHYCYFPEVARRKDEILALLSQYWRDTVRERVPLQSYIVDFAVLSVPADVHGAAMGGGGTPVIVVELNPFASTTGGCLFDWKTDEEVLAKGPLTMRVHETPLKQITDLVDYSISQLYSPLAVDVADEKRFNEPLWRSGRSNSSLCESRRKCALM